MKIPKQRKIGPIMGMLKLIVGQVTPYISWLNLALVGIMSFYTTLGPIFAGIGIDLSIWAFIAAMALVVIALIIFEWVFMFPSFYAANNRQSWAHDNPMREKMEELDLNMKEIKSDMVEIKRALKID
jgi:hypothetical protein